MPKYDLIISVYLFKAFPCESMRHVRLDTKILKLSPHRYHQFSTRASRSRSLKVVVVVVLLLVVVVVTLCKN